MDAELTVLEKTYSAPFVLDRSKLSRMLTIVEQEVRETSTQFQPQFEVLFKNNKRVVLRSFQDVLSLDNSMKNPIRELDIESVFPSHTESSPIPTRVHLYFDSGRYDNITIAVTSPDTRHATELFAELEEQIDRTIDTNWILRYIKTTPALLLAGFAVVFCLLIIAVALVDAEPRIQLSAADSAELQRLLSLARTDSEKIDALVQAKLRELKAFQMSPLDRINWPAMLSLRGAFIALPVIVLIATLAYLIAARYPWVVFAWGDWEQHYNSLLSRRKMLGGVIVAALFIGIMANLFVASIPPLR
jgi:hypothetical protein